MKRTNVLQIILELIVVLGSLTLGVTILVNRILDLPITRTLVGLLIIAIGLIGIVEVFTLKITIKMKSTLSVIASALVIILGIVFIAVQIDPKIVCIIWGAFSIALAAARVITSFRVILKQPLINGVRLITNTTTIVFAIILIIKTLEFVKNYFLFIGIILLIESFFLLIEFIIHRFQK